MRVALFGASLVAATTVSPVQKVVELLGELKTKVANDLKAEASAMEEYTEYCDDEITNKGFAIKTASSKIEEYQAIIEESTGKITEFTAAIEEGGATLAAKDAELKEATDVRESEHKDFEAAEKELVETVDTLARAAAVLKRELSFAQGGSVTSKKLGNLVQALSAIVAAQDTSAAKKVQSFLEDDDLSLAQQPQASVKNYESKSGGIVEAINEMQDKAEEELQTLRRDETKARHGFEMISQSLKDALTNLQKSVEEATANKSATEETSAQATEDLAKTEASKAADEKYKSKMQTECQTKATEWEARQKSGADEMAALDKAKEILTSGVKAFVQTKAVTKRVSKAMAADEQDSRDMFVSEVRKMGRKFNSFALMQLAGKATSDPFVKIRGMVEEMISKLQKEADEEATQEAFCQEESAKSAKARETKTATVDKYQSRIDKAKATKDELKQEVAELQKEISEITKSNKEATKIRTAAHAEYKKASKDFKESAEAVTMAMGVLEEFYGGASLLQQPSFGGAKSDSAGGIISFLEVAQSDFTRLLAESESTEAAEKEAYDALKQDNTVSLATKEASVKGKTSEIKSLSVNISDTGSDLENANTELDAIMEYIEKLKPQCESKAMSYAERKARRDSEISGLKSALEILSGDEPAVLLQKRAFLAKN
jgi:chromosome segregation ATPase